jgi:hypothetical protein
MTTEVIPNADEALIEVRYDGRTTLADRLEARRVAARACEAHGFSRILVDTRAMEADLSLSDVFDLASSLWSSELPRGVRIVVLADESQPTEDFLALVAQNRGFPLRLARDRRTAVDLLAETAAASAAT